MVFEGDIRKMEEIVQQYMRNLVETSRLGDAREESFYKHLEYLIKHYAKVSQMEKIEVTILPKRAQGGNPDFRVWDGEHHIIGYIEAKDPRTVKNLDHIEDTEQIKRYISTFPNIVLTDFYEFRLYRNSERISQVIIGDKPIANRLMTAPPARNIEHLIKLFDMFFSFSIPKIETADTLAKELAKRTRFLKDILFGEMDQGSASKGNDEKYDDWITGFYKAFKEYLIPTLKKEDFADLYAQTIAYGLFCARTRLPGDTNQFNRKQAFYYIPNTIGILRDIFRFISLEDPPRSLEAIVDDIAELLSATDMKKILSEYHYRGKGADPIIHFYETFLAQYDPEIRERRGVYYTPHAVVCYIVRAINTILKTHFKLEDGFANERVKILDPCAGTLSFLAETIQVAAEEFMKRYGSGGVQRWIKTHVLENFYAFELMMAAYAIGHLKIGLVLEDLGYKMAQGERFKLYLTNTLEMEEIKQIALPGLSSLSEESHLAGMVKKEQPLLVILGNPPYSGISANISKWTEQLLKEDKDGAQSYYKVDGKPLEEKNPKWLQDDYVKFLRFAQWKIQGSGYGIVGMITNHSYLDNPTFRGMRQSLMKTFDEIYILNLHGNSLKRETIPDGGKDENVFDIRQGVAIALFIRNKDKINQKVFYRDLYGLREDKYRWLSDNSFDPANYKEITPSSPWYFFVPTSTSHIQHYQKWKRVSEIFRIYSVGIVTSRDNLVIGFTRSEIRNKMLFFFNTRQIDEIIAHTFNLKDKANWKLSEARKSLSKIEDIDLYIKEILYRPFDQRCIFYHQDLIERMRPEVMRHMLRENIGLITSRIIKGGQYHHAFISRNITDASLLASNTASSSYLFPLYLFDKDKSEEDLLCQNQTEKEGNILPLIFEELESNYGERLAPEDILYYIYAVLYSNIYRKNYADFLKIDFPRVPFTNNFELFKAMGKLGKRLVDLHLLSSPEIHQPVAKYHGSSSNDCIQKIIYKADEHRIYINKDKYFEGIAPEVWNYYIGGYQVLRKYLEDRIQREIDDAPHYSRIATAISKTIEIQTEIDNIYPEVEAEVMDL